MIKAGDLEFNKEYWYSYIEFSRSSTRVNKKALPQKVVYVPVEDNNEYYKSRSIVGFIKSLTGRYIYNVYSYSKVFEFIYKTEEEAIEGFNTELYSELDKIKYEYELKQKIINKNFILNKNEGD